MEMTPLPHVYAWLFRTASAVAPDPLAWAYLDDSEYRRAMGFRFDSDRWLYVKAHGWLRAVLGKFTGQSPRSVMIHQRPGQKPRFLKTDSRHPNLYFNLSHSDGYVGIVISRTCEVGIDIERIRAVSDVVGMAQSILHPRELQCFYAMPEPARDAYFLRVWTVKEAYTKALGFGLAHPFNRFSVEFDVTAANSECVVRDPFNSGPAYVYSGEVNLPLDIPAPKYAFSLAALSAQISLTINHVIEPGYEYFAQP